MTAAGAATPYTQRNIEQMLGLSKGIVSSLVKAGYVTPARGPRREHLFSFQDVVLLRTAYNLQAANIPPRRLVQSLKRLRDKLPAEVPLSGLRIRAIGNDVAVREGTAPWEAASGQLLMDFEVSGAPGSVAILERTPPATGPAALSAADLFARGQRLEDSDPAAAETAYRDALLLDSDHVYTYVNLGALLCDAGRCGEAVSLYEHAMALAPDAPLVFFNAAMALEDQHRDADALRCYQRCLQLAPDTADAHYNAARLCEKLGDAQGALRHYSAYRRLERALPETSA